jgi:hypothetical protein
VHPTIAGIMATQHGLVTRGQAIEAGLTAEAVDRLARTGAWVSVRRGVYADRQLWERLTGPDERQLTRDRAASLRISRPHVMSHDSAALELGMDVLRPSAQVTHVTRPGVVGSHLRYGVKHHLAPYRPDQVIEVSGRGCSIRPGRPPTSRANTVSRREWSPSTRRSASDAPMLTSKRPAHR